MYIYALCHTPLYREGLLMALLLFSLFCNVKSVVNKRIMDDEFMFVMVWCRQLFDQVSSLKELCGLFSDISHVFMNSE
jgi:hypothetical protein